MNEGFFHCLGQLLTVSNTERIILFATCLCFSIVCWVISAKFVCHLIWKFRTVGATKNPNVNKYGKFFHGGIAITTLNISFASLIASIMTVFYFAFWFPLHDNNVNYNNICKTPDFSTLYLHILNPIAAFIININYILILIIYYFRLVLLFKGSMFEISKKQKIFFKICIFCVLLISGCIILWGLLGIWELWLRTLLIFLVFYGFVAIMLCIFMRKHFMQIIKFYNSANNLDNIGTDIKDLQNDRTKSLIESMRKLVVLVYFSLFSTMLLFIIVEFISQQNYYATICYWILLEIDFVINISCITMQFSFGKSIYNLCCKRCEHSKFVNAECHFN